MDAFLKNINFLYYSMTCRTRRNRNHRGGIGVEDIKNMGSSLVSGIKDSVSDAVNKASKFIPGTSSSQPNTQLNTDASLYASQPEVGGRRYRRSRRQSRRSRVRKWR
jgi:hypothetical protein